MAVWGYYLDSPYVLTITAIVGFWLIFALIVRISQGGGKIPSEGKVVLVTGAASGIGRATVQSLVKRGCIVYAGDLSPMEAIYGDNPQVVPVQLDVTKDDSLDKVVALVKKNGHSVYGIVNSAGIALTKATDINKIQSSAEIGVDSHIAPIININLLGTMRANHAVFPMIAQNKGCIVNIASVAGRIWVPFMSAYCASKAGVMAYSSCLRRELLYIGVRVACIEPGFVNTHMVDTSLRKMDAKKLDFSETILPQTPFYTTIHDQAQKGSLIQPDHVAAEITDALFSRHIDTPHKVIDFTVKRWMYVFANSLPHAWLDKVVRAR